ncbi:hypothetical protein FQN60_005285 [Etheostoma spectabile]|uniref:Uncharacterized protein n=1 Tax=Etheostoma spectabile TaxID=54343 RepID=A0A5J5C7B4_9PERO|nr:hypothetical protein FQN60_005285 [Etheostoma spectabile]
MATAGGAAVSPVTMTTGGNSFPDHPFDSAGKTQGVKRKQDVKKRRRRSLGWM